MRRSDLRKFIDTRYDEELYFHQWISGHVYDSDEEKYIYQQSLP